MVIMVDTEQTHLKVEQNNLEAFQDTATKGRFLTPHKTIITRNKRLTNRDKWVWSINLLQEALLQVLQRLEEDQVCKLVVSLMMIIKKRELMKLTLLGLVEINKMKREKCKRKDKSRNLHNSKEMWKLGKKSMNNGKFEKLEMP
jgi:hypothetical protein